MDMTRLEALAAKLTATIDDLQGLHDRYDAMDEDSEESRQLFASDKARWTHSLIASYKRHLAMVNFLLGDDADLPIARWMQRELGGETLTYDPETRSLVPWTAD